MEKKSRKSFGNYYLGLDIGTNSVGWAVTDEQYKLQKLNGKTLWGVRLFEEATPAKDRRMHRAARRRLQRRNQRLALLQELFAEAISEKDPGFYLRLKESKFYQEDKSVDQPFAIFSDYNYTDKRYHEDYPTIYHLRKKLIDSNESHDVRLVYLAISHILKRRGHFLFEGDLANIISFDNVWKELCAYLGDELEIEISTDNTEQIKNILKDRSIGVGERKKQMIKLLDVTNDFKDDIKQLKAVIGLMTGTTEKLNDIFPNLDLTSCEVQKISFADGKYDEQQDVLTDAMEEKFYLIEKLKAIYDWAVLVDILKGSKYISHSKVEIYRKHQEDLLLLKDVIRQYHPDEYKKIFKDTKFEFGYTAYIGTVKIKGKKVIPDKKCSQEELSKYIEKILDKDIKDDEYVYVKTEAQNRTLLPKQKIKENGVVPHQLHLEELKKILENTSSHLEFLNKTDENGLSIKGKILQIFSFKIPYYVGPLNDFHKKEDSKQCWIVKKSDEKIWPWNFEHVVDKDASMEQFIRRMTSKCTYLTGADVLPKNSLLYSKYMLLNELNILKINGEKISVRVKQRIYDELYIEAFRRGKFKKVTKKRLEGYLISEGFMDKNDELSGIDSEIVASLSSQKDFMRILGGKAKQEKAIEEIIKWITLFSGEKKMLFTRIKNIYGNLFSEDEIKQFCSLRYTGWGRLSRELLQDIVHVDKTTGECFNIMSMLWNTNENLMHLLSEKYDFIGRIKGYNAEKTGQNTQLTYNTVDELYVSPVVKRQIWQCFVIVDEIREIMGHNPQKVFIEVAREEGEKKKTTSRKNKLLELYKSCKEESRDWVGEISGKTESDFRSIRLYLYYTQMGRCMYTGESISLDQLFNANLYDRDHIYPQSKVKDDSLDNLVLAKRDANGAKGDSYPVSREVQKGQASYWKMLLDKGLISKSKYEKLTRTAPFENGELADFIARQIVETRQSTKAVANILKQVFRDSEIVYSKAKNISDFRQKYDMVKTREVNDHHHAKDAYLNIIAGNVYHTKFTSSPMNFINDPKCPKYNLRRMYEFEVKRGNMTAWIPGESGTIGQVRKTMAKNNVLFTRLAYEAKGEISDQQLRKKGEGQLPIKSSDPRLCNIDKYGGYNKVKGAYFILVEHTEKNKKIRAIRHVPVHLAGKIQDDENALYAYCTSKGGLGLSDPVILISKIKIDSLFMIDGFPMHLSGRQNTQLIFKGAAQLIIGKEHEEYIKKIIKFVDRKKELKSDIKVSKWDGIQKDLNLELYNNFKNKLADTIYAVRLGEQAKTLQKGSDTFAELSVEEQCIVLSEILRFFQCNSTKANLDLIRGSKVAGSILTSCNISNYQSVYLIYQSATGVFEQTIDLLAPAESFLKAGK